MWMLGLIFAILIIVAIVALIRPLFSTYSKEALAEKQQQVNQRKAINIELFEQKKAQIEQDFQLGLLDEDAKVQAYHEIEHRLIQDAQVSESVELQQLSPVHAKQLTILFVIFISLFSVITYTFIKPQKFDQVVLGKADTSETVKSNAPDINAMVTSLEKKLEANPDNLEGWNMLGRSYVVMKQYDKALTAYENALTLNAKANEKVSGLEINYVEALMHTGDDSNFIKAREILKNLLIENPSNADALWFMGFLDYQLGNMTLAIERWTNLLSMLPRDSEQANIVLSYLNRVKAEMSGIDPAVGTVSTGQNQANQGSSGQTSMTSAEEQAFIASMVAKVENRVKENPQDFKSWKMLGKSYSVLKRYNDSAQAYSKAIALDSTDVQLLVDYSKVVIQTGEQRVMDDALIVFAKMLDENANNMDALFLSGLLSKSSGDVTQARMFWEKLLPLVKEDSPAYQSVKQSLDSLN